MEAERSRGTAIPTAQGSARAVRAIMSLAAALFFLQITVLAPADVSAALGFSSQDLGHRWWTMATFTLVHVDFWPLAANLLVLGTVGTVLERRWGTGEFIRYYAVCALGAWIVHVTFVPGDTTLTGATAPAIGIMLAYAAFVGDAQHFRVGSIGMSTGLLAVIATVGLLLIGMATAAPQAAGAYLAHAGGLAAAWVYLRVASSINLGRFRNSVSPIPDEPDDMPPRAIPKGQSKIQRMEDDIVARSNAAVAREAATRQSMSPRIPDGHDANPLNRLLDKISAQGIESLTVDERKLLDDVSRRLRDH